MRHFIISAVKERLNKINAEKMELEKFLDEESGLIKEVRNAMSLPQVNISFQSWLKAKNIKLKPKDKRYSKFYQRYKAEGKK